MNVLILGGTGFVGRHIALAALGAGMQVTLFNRGTKPDAPAGTNSLIGDRDGGLEALHGRRFDAVVDVSGYLPRLVASSAELLEPLTGRYLFISTVSVYDMSRLGPNGDEDAPLASSGEPPLGEEITNASYGPLKVACEEAVSRTYGPERTTVVRPSVVVGPHDPSDRFTYWVRRLAQGGRFLAPGAPSDPTQWIDAHDLGAFVTKLLAEDVSGTFNAATPADSRTIGGLLAACEEAGAASGSFAGRLPSTAVWAAAEQLEEHQVAPFRDMTMWLPPPHDSLLRVSCQRAVAAGLTHRTTEQTVADTLAWDVARGLPPLKAGLAAEREGEILALLA